MRVHIDLLQGMKLIGQFRNPFVAGTNLPPKIVGSGFQASDSVPCDALSSQPYAYRSLHHLQECPIGSVGRGRVEGWVGKKPNPECARIREWTIRCGGNRLLKGGCRCLSILEQCKHRTCEMHLITGPVLGAGAQQRYLFSMYSFQGGCVGGIGLK